MSYYGNWHCRKITFKFKFDPYDAVSMPLQNMPAKTRNFTFFPSITRAWNKRLIWNLKAYTIVGGSGLDMHYSHCADCSVLIYNKPKLLEGIAYIPDGLLDGQIEFKSTVELLVTNRQLWNACKNCWKIWSKENKKSNNDWIFFE